MYVLVSVFSCYGGCYGGRFVLFGLASPSKNSSLAEIRRMAAFFGKEDLPTIKQPLYETFSLEDEQSVGKCRLTFSGRFRTKDYIVNIMNEVSFPFHFSCTLMLFGMSMAYIEEGKRTLFYFLLSLPFYLAYLPSASQP